jgi:hypothetical protein
MSTHSGHPAFLLHGRLKVAAKRWRNNQRPAGASVEAILLFSYSPFADLTGSVLDGDTIEVLHNTRPERIRLSGIHCPEKGQPYGKHLPARILERSCPQARNVQSRRVSVANWSSGISLNSRPKWESRFQRITALGTCMGAC